MTEGQLVGFAGATAASFAWMIGTRTKSRLVRALGVVITLTGWVALRWAGTR